MKDNGTAIFWKVDQATRVALMEYQHRKYKTKLSIANQRPPWEEVPPVPDIPVNEDSEELERLQSLPPLSEGRGGY